MSLIPLQAFVVQAVDSAYAGTFTLICKSSFLLMNFLRIFTLALQCIRGRPLWLKMLGMPQKMGLTLNITCCLLTIK